MPQLQRHADTSRRARAPRAAQGLELLLLRRVRACDPRSLVHCLVALAELGRGPFAPAAPGVRPTINARRAGGGTARTGATAHADGDDASSDSSSGGGGGGGARGPSSGAAHCTGLLLRAVLEAMRAPPFLQALDEAELLRLLGCMAKVRVHAHAACVCVHACFPVPRRVAPLASHTPASAPHHISFAPAPALHAPRCPHRCPHHYVPRAVRAAHAPCAGRAAAPVWSPAHCALLGRAARARAALLLAGGAGWLCVCACVCMHAALLLACGGRALHAATTAGRLCTCLYQRTQPVSAHTLCALSATRPRAPTAAAVRARPRRPRTRPSLRCPRGCCTTLRWTRRRCAPRATCRRVGRWRARWPASCRCTGGGPARAALAHTGCSGAPCVAASAQLS